jgi:predicted nucleic acid-binding protein
MRRFFVDTFYWIALFSVRDRWHGRVAAFDDALDATDQLSTTDEVFTEFLTYYSPATPRLRTRAARFVQTLLDTQGLAVLPQTRTGFLQALALYSTRPDKHYSLTDCSSMQVMRREGLTEVLTNDRHFTQEGFHILFP